MMLLFLMVRLLSMMMVMMSLNFNIRITVPIRFIVWEWQRAVMTGTTSWSIPARSFIFVCFCRVLGLFLFFQLNFLHVIRKLFLQLFHLLFNTFLFLTKFLLNFCLILLDLRTDCFGLTFFLVTHSKFLFVASIGFDTTLDQRALILRLEV